ncbi:MAG: hypothetical protein WC678_02835 [Parcubacteria group bacterium]|jgi:pimeloyl-ACP methyl ester carboxylesterase
MKKSKKYFLLATVMAVFVAIVCPQRAAAVTEILADINEPTTWTAAGSPYIIQGLLSINAPLTIEPGVVVKFKNFSNAGLIVTSTFSASGTPSAPIVFTSACDVAYGGETSAYCSYREPLKGDWRGLVFDPQYRQQSTMEYVKVFYAMKGIDHQTNDPYNPYKNYLSVRHSEVRYCSMAGIALRYAQPILDQLTLSNNYNGVEIIGANPERVPKIRNSAIFGNHDGVRAAYGGNPMVSFDARYNWWGSSTGPKYVYQNSGKEKDNPAGTGNRIVGTGVLFRPWSESDPTVPKEPVIFIPGIGASINPDLMISGVLADNWTMFDHTYDGILTAFRAMGYVEGQNFFIGYYDWRKSNVDSAKNYLQPLIQKALAKNDADKVNIVTHSMGSLVARSYVQSNDYASDVNNLIMIAPPNRGSSDVYTAWEGGYIPKNWNMRTLMYAYLDYMSVKKLTFNTYETIHNHIPSLKELMPTYDYLQPAGASSLKNYQAMEEQNTFLQGLGTDIAKLNERTRLSIILGDKQETVNKIPVVPTDEEELWKDGKPDPIDPERDDAEGDGEVLITSGDVSSDFRDVLEYDHRQIVSRSEKIVAERLDKTLADIFDAPEVTDELTIWTDAPADLEVTDPDGDTISRDNEEITDSRYAEEKNKDGFKITSIPNPKTGEYTIRLHGNENGADGEKHHLSVEYVNFDGEHEDQSEATEVEVKKEEEQEFGVVSNPPDSDRPIEDLVEHDITPPELTVSAPQEGREYANNEIVTLQYTIFDAVSALENLVIEKWLDDEEVTGNTLDLADVELGEHQFWLYATDEAGNWSNLCVSFTVKEAVVVDEEEPPISDPDPTLDPDPDPDLDSDPDPESDPDLDSDPDPTSDPEPDPDPPIVEDDSTNPPAEADADSEAEAETETTEDSSVIVATVETATEQHHKKKQSTKKTKATKKKAKSGVTKYMGEIKIISSSTNFPPEPKSVMDVFGVMPIPDPRMASWLDDELIFPAEAAASGQASADESMPAKEANQAGSQFSSKRFKLMFEPLAVFIARGPKLSAAGRVAGASSVRQNKTFAENWFNYSFWGLLVVFLALLGQSFHGKIKNRSKRAKG